MGIFGNKSSNGSDLPSEILDSVNTMQDDLDVLAGKKAPKQNVQAKAAVSRPGIFNDNPALRNTPPATRNGLTSPVVVTAVDRSGARPDPRESSPFLLEKEENLSEPTRKDSTENPLKLDTLPPKPISSIPPSTLPIAPDAFPGNGGMRPKKELPFSGKPVFQEKPAEKSGKGLLIAGLVLLFVALLAGGAFAYFFFSSKSTEEPNMQAQEMTPTETALPQSEQSSEAPNVSTPFSLSSPNYLSVDVETITPEAFRGLLLEKSELLRVSGIAQPVEFFVTDKNNNPVAFARFASLMKISLSQAVLDQIEESFSLYLFLDDGVARAGLTVSFKNKDLLKQAIEKSESEIPFALQAIYLNHSPKAKISTGKFSSGSHNGFEIRYFNITGGEGLSVDYALLGKKWAIGTSKNTLRSIIDTFGPSL